MAVINRQPTNPPAPRLCLSEIDELRALVEAGREADALAELRAKARVANAKAVEAVKLNASELNYKTERVRMEQAEHMARMAVCEAQQRAIPVADTNENEKTEKKGSNRDKRIFLRKKELRATKEKAFLRILAKEEGVSISAVKQAIVRHIKRIDNEHQQRPPEFSLLGQLRRANN
jgi:hypothetical protein